ncbi:histone-lysine N-methyltransferase, H3 lysine-79 specific-like [Pelmatolapia mariae]|uniref:histone-lysine N-methyltransferase, H3 lysine-79 specific-like n=1 Tax=Pelmatolapia mariae TaxID=158779 RepID=UPI002FE63D26
MNQREWKDAVHRLQRLLEPSRHSMGNASRGHRDWDTYHEHSRYTVPEPHRSDVRWKELSSSSHHVHSKVPEVEDPDGEPLPYSEEDVELARNKQLLREMEERIMHKKATLAMKTRFVETPPGVSGDEQPAMCVDQTLRDRVKEILMQRQYLSYFSKVQSARERRSSSCPSKGGVLQEQHPLKLRVKVVMKKRHTVLPPYSEQDPDVAWPPSSPSVTSPAKREDVINKGFECFLSVLNKGVDINLLKPEDDCGEVPGVSLPPLGRSISSPAKDENNVNKGFERFLSILNKGVDIEKFNKIMSNDREDLPLGEEPLNIQLPDMESKSDPPFRTEKQQLNSGASLLGLRQPSESILSMDNDIEPSLTQRKESQRLFSGASLQGLSPPSENQCSNSRAILLLSQASESQRSKTEASLKGFSHPSKSIGSGASQPVLSKASDSERAGSGALLTDFNHASESQQLNTGASLSGFSLPSENQHSKTRPILLSHGWESESHLSKSGSSLKDLSQKNESLLSTANEGEPGLNQAKESQRLNTGASLKGLSQSSEGTGSGAPQPGLNKAKDSVRSDSGVQLTGLSQANESQQLNTGATSPSENQLSNTKPVRLNLNWASKSQSLKSGPLLKGLNQDSKSQHLKSGTLIPGLGDDSDSESNGRNLLAGLNKTNSREKETDSSTRERLFLPGDEEKKKKSKRDHSLGSSNRLKSPVALKKKKEEEEETSSVSEQREQLQSILKTLGWNLDVDELSKLANRTQERLCGRKNERVNSKEEHERRQKHSRDRDRRKSSSRSPLRSSKTDQSQERMHGSKNEGRVRKSEGRRRTDSRGEDETQQRRSLRDHRNSSSSSSSRSASRSSSPSPSCRRRSRSRDLKRRQKAERSRSRERSRERLKHRDRWNSRETLRDRERKDSKHFSAHPYSQNPVFPHPAASPFPDYILSQYSHFALTQSGHYSGATNPYWSYNQYNTPPSLSGSSHPYPHFPGPVVAPNMALPDPSLLTNSASFPNPDLSVSEGQDGSASVSRCLRVINTEQASSQSLTGGHNWRRGHKELRGDFRNPKNILEKHNNALKTPLAPQDSKVCTKTVGNDPCTEELKEEKPQLTEEEIKANLRKKLEAFNQKAKNTSQMPHSKVMQPANSLISEID